MTSKADPARIASNGELFRAGIYTRISRDSSGQALGVARQETSCRKLVEAFGGDVVDVYSDNDCSAFKSNGRPQYQRLLTDLRDGKINTVVAWHPDRIFRRQKDLVEFVDAVDAAGASVHTVSAGLIDLSTATGRMTARIVGAVAEHEAEHKGERVAAKHRELARRGRWVGGAPPYGYRNVGDGMLEFDRDRAGVLLEASQRLLIGESTRSICDDFMARGVPTPRGGRWRPQELRRMVSNPALVGKRMHKGQVAAQAIWEPLFDEVTFEKLQRILDFPEPTFSIKGRYTLLSHGLLRCGKCGWQLYGAGNGESRWYGCSTAHGPGCGTVYIAADRADETITHSVVDRLAGPDRPVIVPPTTPPHEVLERVIDGRARLRELSARRAKNRIPEGAWGQQRRELTAELEAVRMQWGLVAQWKVLVDLPATAEDMRAQWPTLHMSRRRAIVAALIDHITVRPGGQGVRFDRSRITDGMTWAV